jgi:hypothetical protein
MPDESRIPEIGSFGLTRRGRSEDLSFTLQDDRCYVHLFEYLEPENNHGAKNGGKDKTAKTGAQLVKLRFSKAF